MRDWILIEFCISFFMIKYSKFTDNIGSGNFTDIFCQNINKFPKRGGAWVLNIPHTHPLDTPLVRIINFQPNQGISIPVPVQAKIQLTI